jgi:hypothetical protein
MPRKSALKLEHQGLAINADIRTEKLSAESVEERPEVITRDRKTGNLVISQIYDKATEEPLEAGYGYRYVDEEGNEVTKDDLEYFVVEDDEERRVKKREPTLGRGRTITPITWIPIDQINHYLIDRTYEIWGEEDLDIAQLYQLAQHITEFEEAPVIPVVLQPTFYKDWGIITPEFYDEEFSLIMRITSEKIEPGHRMPQLTEADIKARQEAEEAETIEQETPF